ncbi:MAG TPA: DUF2130 domain-containing protein, partial [Sphingobacteriaceae bacterium]|nr:DUF2130 domain-containing protein [Sphingobacteriaceae bacterium]
MSTEVKCPGCGYTFPIEEVMTEEYKKELREKMNAFKKEKDEELQAKLQEFDKQSRQKQLEYD